MPTAHIVVAPSEDVRFGIIASGTLLHLVTAMMLVDYVPCWPTPAVDDDGMGFMYCNAAD